MIHETAIVHRDAEIGEDVEIGPYCVVENGVRIGNRTRLLAHVVVHEGTEIGEDCLIGPFSCLGGPPQDITYRGEKTRLVIGDRNVLREYVTMNRGTRGGGGVTRVGNDNFFMAYVHIAHDCQVGSHVIMANCATLAGHVQVEDYAVFSGLCAVHQFCRVGRYAFISGMTGVPKDVPPFVIAAGVRAKLYGLNLVGLERHGFKKEEISLLKKAYRLIFRSTLPLSTSLKIVEEQIKSPYVEEFIGFIRSSKRGICR
jgi:UDP-N-acetylglucosamine acyltransferase